MWTQLLVRKSCNFLLSEDIFSDSDEIMNCGEAGNLSEDQKYQIQELFTQGVKHKMRMNFVRQMSKTSSKMKYSYLRDYRVWSYDLKFAE